MAHSHWWYLGLILLVGGERVVELVVSTRNAAWSKSRGGREYGMGHFPPMVVLHTGLLIGAPLEVVLADRTFTPLSGWPMLLLVAAAQALRWWCIATLGRRWNTRIIVVPGLPLVRTGPYRVLQHPNYVAVVIEGVALPLVGSAWVTAVVFTVANAALLRVRVSAENDALRAAVAA